MKIISVVETRTELFKAAAICEAIQAFKRLGQVAPVEHTLVHLGQANSSGGCDLYFNDIDLPKPDFFLGVPAAASLLEKTGVISERFSHLLLQERPQAVMLIADSDLAVECALATKRMGYRGTRPGKAFVPALAVIKAGVRNFERSGSREVNRVIVSLLADYLFISEENAALNLCREGIARDRMHFVGSVNIDILRRHHGRAMGSSVLNDLNLTSGLETKPFVLLTLQHLSGAAGVAKLSRLQPALSKIAQHIPVVLPATPATLQCIHEADLDDYFVDHPLDGPEPWDARVRIRLIPQVGYLDFVKLMIAAKIALTDCPDIQEEISVLGVPFISLADGESGPAFLDVMTKALVASDLKQFLGIFYSLSRRGASCSLPRGNDGRAAQRIIQILWSDFGAGKLGASDRRSNVTDSSQR
jgi:UDP-N-acetylglucosamine 2-epimerase (non-hydrolysing)